MNVAVLGHCGLVGSAIVRALRARAIEPATAEGVDLTDERETLGWFEAAKPTHVYLCAARVGGIGANISQCGDFILENLAIQNEVIFAARETNVEKLLFLGSSCIYPRDCPQPIREEYLMTGPLEETNRPYAIAKIAGIELLRAYRKQYGLRSVAVMPSNLYGPGDKFTDDGHALPAMMRRMHEAKLSGAKEFVVLGSGRPLREWLHVDDLADACVKLMAEHDDSEPINVGSGEEITIGDLAWEIASVVGWSGQLLFDESKPDGTPRKVLDSSRIRVMGWAPRRTLRDGLRETYRWYCEHNP